MKIICVLALPQALASSMAIPLEMIHAADTLHRIRHRQRHSNIELHTVAEDGAALTVAGGLTLTPSATLNDMMQPDLVFVPALWGNPRRAIHQSQAAVQWIQQCYAQGTTFCSVGSGSYFLAEAGLLNGRKATTHWRFFKEFAHDYPQVRLEQKRFITHQDRLYCTGSVSAVRDVMVHFIERMYNADIANEVARHFTHELKRSQESILLSQAPHHSHHDETIIKIQEWLQANYARDLTMKEVAQRFGLNIRTFNRRFRQAADKSALDYLQEIRTDQATQLLKHSNLSIAEIAFAVGYQDVSYFTGLFRRRQGMTPKAYRHMVRTKLFNLTDDTSQRGV